MQATASFFLNLIGIRALPDALRLEIQKNAHPLRQSGVLTRSSPTDKARCLLLDDMPYKDAGNEERKFGILRFAWLHSLLRSA